MNLVHPDDQELVLRSLTTIQDKEVGDPIEIRVESVTGWRPVEFVGTPLRLSGKNLVLLCFRDVTKRRRFELASGQPCAVSGPLVHNAGSVIMLVSATGLLESASGAITRLLGHDPELIEMRPLTDIVAEPDRRQVMTALSQAAREAPQRPTRSPLGWNCSAMTGSPRCRSNPASWTSLRIPPWRAS